MLSIDRWLPFEEAVFDRTRLVIKIQRSDYLTEGKIPVIDQGQEDISGYTSEPNAAYPGPLPVVLFGDHTRALKFVDRPFAAGADGVKVLEPSSDLDAKFLWYYLRSRRLPNDGYSRHFKHLRKLRVPIPPAGEQRRVVDLLSRAENIVRMRREAEQKAKEIIPALFLDMFGDPATNPKWWGIRSVEDMIRSADYGTSTKAIENGAGIPMIRMGNVDAAGRLNLEDLKYVVLLEQEQRKYALMPGDILFNRTNSKDLVGKTGIWRGATIAVAASYFIRVRVNEDMILPDYFWAFMNSRHMKAVLFLTARGAIGQSNINAQELRALSIPCPPIQSQRMFAQRVMEALDLEVQQTQGVAVAEEAFRSLLTGVFGEA